MKRTARALVLLGISGVALSAFGQGKEPSAGPTQVKVGAIDGKLGLEYRVDAEYADHGLLKDPGTTPAKTFNTDVRTAKLKFLGALTPSVDYKVQYNLVKNSIENLMANWKLSPNLSIGFGKSKLRQGGFEVKGASYENFIFSPYRDAWKPFNEYDTSIELAAKVLGTISLQLVNDVSRKSYPGQGGSYAAATSQVGLQPATLVEWVGDVGGVMPLVQLGAYDAGNSRFAALGVKASVAGIDFSADLVNDQRARVALDKKIIDQLTNIALFVSYDADVVRPFVKFAKFDRKQADDAASNATDAKGNSAVRSAIAAGASPLDDTKGSSNFEDNGTVLSVGTFVVEQAKLYRPFVAYSARSGTFYAEATGDKTETRTETFVRLGVCGDF